MSDVALQINGRTYRVRAKDGEEEKLRRAGELVDERCRIAKQAMGSVSDSSLFFYVALMLADDAVEGGAVPATAPARTDDATVERVDTLAAALESLADRLERAAQAS